MTKFDSTDEQIIGILSNDARTSNREVARLIGLSEAGVRKRLKRLSATNAAKITAVVNPASVGLFVSAFVRLRTSPAVARQVALAAADLEFVSFAALTAGRFNVVALVLAADHQRLADFIHSTFRCWKDVHEISTIELVSATKHRLDLILITQ